MSNTTIKTVGIFAILTLMTAILANCGHSPPENSRPAQAMRGKKIFEAQCISCHGLGDVAPTVDSLEMPAPNLAKIMERRRRTNKFPIVEIARIIDGRRALAAHGPREMPIWGEVYTQEEGLDENELRGRKGELIAFLMSIQSRD